LPLRFLSRSGILLRLGRERSNLVADIPVLLLESAFWVLMVLDFRLLFVNDKLGPLAEIKVRSILMESIHTPFILDDLFFEQLVHTVSVLEVLLNRYSVLHLSLRHLLILLSMRRQLLLVVDNPSLPRAEIPAQILSRESGFFFFLLMRCNLRLGIRAVTNPLVLLLRVVRVRHVELLILAVGVADKGTNPLYLPVIWARLCLIGRDEVGRQHCHASATTSAPV
jgi:hypothetical protein